MEFNLPKNKSSVIKVIGVGGGGSNAVNHMENIGVEGVDFIICNTDRQALENSPVANKIQLGMSVTEGLGAGADPEIGAEAARESLPQILEVLENNTKMCFITAGMGGGTGTGAAPIIAKAAKDLGILTIAIVTYPFEFEGEGRTIQADSGIAALRQSVDSLIVINNNKLQQIYGVLRYRAAFAKADEILANAAKGIAEIITKHYNTNIDLHDVKTVLKNSGTALFGTGEGKGTERAVMAAEAALDSPLLDDSQITGARQVLLLIASGDGEDEVTLQEVTAINRYVQEKAGNHANIIMGIGNHPDFTGIRVTVIATGFPTGEGKTKRTKSERTVHLLDDDSSDDTPHPIAWKGSRDGVSDADDPMSQPLAQAELPLEDYHPSHAEAHLPFEDEEENQEHEATIVWTLNDDLEEEDEGVASWGDETVKTATQSANAAEGAEEDERVFSLDDIEGEGLTLEFAEPTEADDNVEDFYDAFHQSIDETKSNNEHFAATQNMTRNGTSTETQQQFKPAEIEENTSDPELNFKVKRLDTTEVVHVPKNIDPMMMPFDALPATGLHQLAEERKLKMSNMNKRYAANQNTRKDIDKVPAYKRKGLDIHTDKRSEAPPQQMRIDEQGNFKTNNSFLHDNVD